MSDPTPPLDALAKAYRVQTSYYDDRGKLITPSADALITVLRVLGAPIQNAADAPDALRARTGTVWRRVVEPVHVAPDGRAGDMPLRLPATLASATITCRLVLEDGE